MKRGIFRLCSMLLVLTILVNMLPMSIFAQELQQATATQTQTQEVVEEDANIVKEIVENRTEYTKEFSLDNGLVVAAVYTQPVHYLDDGQWKDIDNTLVTASDGTLTNTAGVWEVSFPQQLSKTDPVTITKDGHTLSFVMSGELRNSGNLEVMSAGEEVTAATIPAETAAAENLGSVLTVETTEATEETTEATEETAETTEVTAETTEVTAETTEATAETTVGSERATETIDATLSGELTVETASVTVDGNVQTFGVSSAKASTGAIRAVDLTEAKAAAQFDELVLDKTSSQLVYADVYGNTDVRYDLQGNKVKESIILNSYDSGLRGYRYTLHVGDMVPVLYSDGAIEFYDAQQEQIVMYMPGPYLVDDAHKHNYDIQVSLTGSQGIYTLTYILPNAWLAASDRQWPVVLDPAVTTKPDVLNTRDHTVASNGSYSYLRDVLECGYGSSYHKHWFFIKYLTLPTLTSSDVLLGATMSLYKPQDASNQVPVNVHKVLGTWESETLTWSNKPGYDTTIEDYALVTGSGWYHWDVTDIARGWYSGDNTGMMFKAADAYEDGTDTTTWKQFASSDNGASSWMPSLTLVYRNNNGLEGYWDYTTASAGRAGTGYINNYTGNLVWVRDDIGFGGNRMPVTIQHVFNANDVVTPSDSNNANDTAGNSFGMGLGWRTNYNQLVYQWSEDSSYYVWEDSDGTDHYFQYVSSGTYEDEDGLELTLKTTGSGTKKYSITDKNGNVSYFDTYGRLTQITNNQETKSSITVTYTTTSGKLISKITDGVGRAYSFTYTNSLLSRISYQSGVSYVDFTYTGNRLMQITDKDGKSSTYDYTAGRGLLKKATDVDGYTVNYTYNSGMEDWQPYRVLSVNETDGSQTGGSLSITYEHNQTTFTDHNGNVEIHQFNNMGNTICIRDDEGRAQYTQFAKNDAKETGKTAHQLTLQSDLQNTVGNRLKNSSFENGYVWSVYPSDSATGVNTTAEAYHGTRSQRLTMSDTATGWGCLLSEGFTIKAGETVTFSAYVKGVKGTSYLLLVNRSTFVTSQKTASVGATGWTRVEVTHTNNSGVDATYCAQFFADPGSQAYIDCAQVEKTNAASRYNLIENGDFRYSGTPAYGWTNNSDCQPTEVRTTVSASAATQLNTNAIKIVGSPTLKKRIYQNVAVSGNAGDTFVLGGWAKGNSTPLEGVDQRGRSFCVHATLHYTDGTTKDFAASFNPDTSAWQYACVPIVAEKAYGSITVSMRYYLNANTVYFDGIQLYKETFGNSYTYDDKGNVTSVKDLQKQKTTYEYTNNNLTKEILPTGAEYTYTYDSYHNVKTATTDEGLVYTFTYDTYGNNTSVSVKSGSVVMKSSATYTSNGNYLATTTDALGKVTTYSYDANTGELLSVKYPEDTDTTKTAYTYDTMYRIASASAKFTGVYTTTGAMGTSSVAYTYTDDQLTKIQTGSTTYNFTYGSFGQRTAVKVGTQPLATYGYTDDENRYLESLDYGNGDGVNYTYDDHGRLTRQTYEDGDTVTYTYDNDGVLVSVKDSATGRTERYYRDSTGRIGKLIQKGTGYAFSIDYTYDTSNRVTQLYEEIDGYGRSSWYTYDGDSRLATYQKGWVKNAYDYDGLGRLYGKWTSNKGTLIKTTSYTFTSPSSTAASGQVANMKTTVSGQSLTYDYTYTYDDNGNILSVSDGTYTTYYQYDEANQLIREDNQKAGYTYVWAYDGSGNLENRREYAYTRAAIDVGTNPGTLYDYKYTNSGWRDQLTAINNRTFTYDQIGNTLTDGTWTYTWEHGRQLATLSDGTTTWTNTYNADGLRTKRTDGTTTYSYNYCGGQLLSMYKGSDKIYLSYEPDGTPMSLVYSGNTYYYVTNLQGDVVAILDSSGNTVVQYSYDAWGNILTTTGTMAATLGQINPLRYRGYVYDNETGLYYVSSRYYDPEIGRWISPEPNVDYGEFDEGAGLLGYNVYAYCANNPVMFKDETGESITLTCVLIGAGIGLLAGGGFGAYRASKKGYSPSDGWKYWKYVVGYGVAGGAVGALVGWGAGALIAKYGVATAATSITKGGGARFSSFNALKRSLGSAGKGKQWHHIVEQCQIGKSGFSKYWIQNSNNVINISNSVHSKVSAYYNSVHRFTNGMRFRDWLSGQSFKTQYEWGIKVLRMYGVKI